jgi:outer membrane protein OmpA-like peptidoglycan-associated protein
MQFPFGVTTWAAAAVLALATTGCATKKYVSQTVSPVEARTTKLEKTSTEHGEAIAKLETGVSRASERAMSADSTAKEAAAAAAKANTQAEQAQNQANQAQTLARRGSDKADQALSAQKAMMNSLTNYKLISTEAIHFKLNSSELTPEDKTQLDSMIQKFDAAKNYAIQLEGFTDTTGPEQFNLELSRRRAEAVARYLALNGKIPLYRISILGFGEADPTADNSTLKGREQNRRVEVGLLELSIPGAGGSSANSASAGDPPTAVAAQR